MLLTAKEAAAKLRVSLSMVYSLVQEGKLRAVRIGRKGRRGKVLIPEKELLKLAQPE